MSLAKSQRLAADRAEKAALKAATVKPLDPPFPYAVQSFDPGYWRIPANPKKL